MSNILQVANSYARKGYTVFPIKTNSKLPVTPHGFKDGSKDENEINYIFNRYSYAKNIAIVCGDVSSLIVIDCDKGENKDGVSEYKKYLADEGINLLTQYMIKTPHDGLHFYYHTDAACLLRPSVAAIFNGVDVRGEGAYVIAPPSQIDGKDYHYIAGCADVPPELPVNLRNRILDLSWKEQSHEIIKRLDNGEDPHVLLEKAKTGEFRSAGMSIDEANKALKNSTRSSNRAAGSKTIDHFSNDGEKIGEGTRNDTLFRTACSLRHQGLPAEDIFAACLAINDGFNPPMKTDEARRCVISALKYKNDGDNPQIAKSDSTEDIAFSGDSKLQVDSRIAPDIVNINGVDVSVRRTKGGVFVEGTTANVRAIISNDPDLKNKVSFDAFRNTIVIKGRMPWDNSKTNNCEILREWGNTDDAGFDAFLNTKYSLSMNPNRIASGVSLSANDNETDSLRNLIDNLQKWDGKKRAATFFIDCLGVKDTKYARAATILWLKGAIARALSPAVKFDYMLMLQGKQGIGKSYILQKLAMNPEFYNDNLNTIDGDAALEKLRGFWIVEMAELLATKKTREVEAIKAFITSQVDSYRAPYARRVERRPRRCVFAGTTNETAFLTDRTGNRRFLPLMCGVIDKKIDMFDKTGDFDKYVQQVWAEIVYYMHDEIAANKFDLVLPVNVEDERQAIFDDAIIDDERVGIIQDYLDHNRNIRICAKQIALDALGLDEKTIESRRQLLFADIRRIMDTMSGWQRSDTKKRCGSYGVQRCWEYIGKDKNDTHDNENCDVLNDKPIDMAVLNAF